MILRELQDPDLIRAQALCIHELSEIRKLSSLVTPIFGIYVEFLDISFLDKFTTIPLALPPTPTTLLLLALNAFGAKSDDLIASIVR